MIPTTRTIMKQTKTKKIHDKIKPVVIIYYNPGAQNQS